MSYASFSIFCPCIANIRRKLISLLNTVSGPFQFRSLMFKHSSCHPIIQLGEIRCFTQQPKKRLRRSPGTRPTCCCCHRQLRPVVLDDCTYPACHVLVLVGCMRSLPHAADRAQALAQDAQSLLAQLACMHDLDVFQGVVKELRCLAVQALDPVRSDRSEKKGASSGGRRACRK